MNPTVWLTFLGAAVALTLAPGPDNIFIIAQGVSRGRRAALLTAWGMCSGIAVHTTAAALGVSAVFYASEVVFQVVKFAGAGYLLYLAYRALRERRPLEMAVSDGEPGLVAHYRRGVLMNVLNPKVALFFLAFLPQFVAVEAGQVWLQMLFLGFLFMAQAVLLFSCIALAAGGIGDFIRRHPKVQRGFSWTAALVFIILALRLAMAGR